MNKKAPLTIILLPLLLLSMFIGVATAKNSTPSRTDRLKAAYICVEASGLINDGNVADAYMLLQRAHQLDPEDVDIAGALADFTIVASLGDSTDFESAYAAMRRRFTSNPTDYTSGLRFAKVAADAYRYKDVRETYRLLSKSLPDRTDFSLDYAWQLAVAYVNGDSAALDSAFAIYDRLEQGLGVTELVSTHRIRAISVTGDTAAMERELQRLYASAPSDANVALTVGQIYDYLARPDSALHYYNIACAEDSTFGEAYLARANSYLERGDSAKYDAEVFDLLENPSLDFTPKLVLLTDYTRALYTDTTYTARIRQMYDAMVEIHPGESQLHFMYGAFLSAVDNPAQATEQFSYAIDLEPDNEDYWRYRIETAAVAGDSVAAIAAGREASARFQNLYYPIITSSLLVQQDKPQEALAVVDSFDISTFTNPEALSAYHQTRADILFKLNEPDSAFAEYDLSISLNSHNALALNNAAYFMACENRDLDRAESYIQRALHDVANEPTYIDTYAWVLFKKKRYTEAHIQIDKALDVFGISVQDGKIVTTDTTAVDVQPSLSDLEFSDEDMEYVEEVVESEIDISSEILDHAGDIYFMCGEPDVALEFWKMAYEIEPTNEKIKKKIINKAYFFE